MVPSACTRFPEAAELHGSEAERLARYYAHSDPLAEEAVAALAGLPDKGQALLSRVLDEGLEPVPEAPEALRRLFAQLEAPPFPVEPEVLDLGGYTFLRCRMGYVVLACLSLPLIYSLPAGNKPLVFSGRLVHRAPVRLKETSRFVLETCRRAGLHPDAEGFKLTVRVRLIHAQVRRLIRQSGRWDSAAWGEPINQLHLAVTNALFSAGVLDGLRTMGYQFAPRESEALMQLLWRYSGWLSGIDPAVLPSSEAEARRLLEVVFAMEGPPDDDSRELTRGVMEAALAYVRHGTVDTAYGISRALIGPERAGALGYPETRWQALVPAFRPFVIGVEYCRIWNVPGVRALASVCGTQMLRHLMSDRGMPGKMGEFVLPDRLSGAPLEASRG